MMNELYGLPKLQAEFPDIFELMAQCRRDIEAITGTTAEDIRRMREDAASIEAMDARSRRGALQAEALHQEMASIRRKLADILATYSPEPVVIPHAQAQTRR